MKEEKRLNAAYGSNLNLEQMAKRCPTAKVYGKGYVQDYQLLFKGKEYNACCTIEKKSGSKVPVLIWELQPEDEKALDDYEGYPRFYEKEDVPVTLEDGATRMVMVYIMTDKILSRIQLHYPNRRYYKIVQEGYQMAGFHEDYLLQALQESEKAMMNESFTHQKEGRIFRNRAFEKCGGEK